MYCHAELWAVYVNYDFHSAYPREDVAESVRSAMSALTGGEAVKVKYEKKD
jgi:hypothetical protein